MTSSLTVDKKGTVSTEENIYFTQEEFDSMYAGVDASELAAQGYVGPVTVDGVEYQLFSTTGDDYSSDETDYTLTATEFVYVPQTQTDYENAELSDEDAQELANQLADSFSFVNITVTFPYKIVATNGVLSEDKKSVTFEGMGKNSTDAALYAYTSKSKKKITISGIDENGCTTKNSVKVAADQKIKKITVNGKTQSSQKVTLKKDGTYTIRVETKDSANVFTVCRDTKKPTVSGVKNGETYKNSVKITFKDKTSGVASATLNGKAIKSGKKVTKSGNYTLKVTDRAGNTKTVKFKLK
jgi:hypothetical protein